MSKKKEVLKKYPVTYKGKVYEARFIDNKLKLYEVTKGLFGIRKRKYVDSASIKLLNDCLDDLGIPLDSPTIHIDQIETLFKLWERQKEKHKISEERRKQRLITQQIQEQTLAEWDGVVE